MLNPLDLTGKTLLITGAASGIGRATAIMLSKLGADLILFDINETKLKTLQKECKPTDFVQAVDLTDSASLNAAIKEAAVQKGPIDGFAHIAGIACIAPLKIASKEMSYKVLDINTIAALEIAKIFSNKKYHRPSGGSIVLISSVYANVGSAANVIYAMSKAAIQGITKSLAVELAGRKIRVNCIAPGFIKTNMNEQMSRFFDDAHNDIVEKMHPLGYGEADDIAYMVAFLMADTSKWITGAILKVDGGFCAQ